MVSQSKETSFPLIHNLTNKSQATTELSCLSVLTSFPLQVTHSATRIVQYTHDNTLNRFGVGQEMMRGFTTSKQPSFYLGMRVLINMWVGCAMNKECIYSDGPRTN